MDSTVNSQSNTVAPKQAECKKMRYSIRKVAAVGATSAGKCNSCGICVKECPAGAISKDNPKVTDKEKCISCMHCVVVCPQKARNCNKVMELIASKKMKKSRSGRKENKLYL